MSTDSVLEFKDVSFGYGAGQKLLSGVDLALPQGGLLLIRGPSGAGKSTLLRLLTRLETPDSGQILYRGRPLESLVPTVLRREVCLVQQSPVLVPGTVRDNLLMPFFFAANAGRRRPGDDVLMDMLARIRLGDVSLDDPALSLSLGQKQRVCLLRAVLPGPGVLLLDEPASGLDHESRAMVEAMVEDLNASQGLSVVMISHQEYVPKAASPIVAVVDKGRVEVSPWTP